MIHKRARNKLYCFACNTVYILPHVSIFLISYRLSVDSKEFYIRQCLYTYIYIIYPNCNAWMGARLPSYYSNSSPTIKIQAFSVIALHILSTVSPFLLIIYNTESPTNPFLMQVFTILFTHKKLFFFLTLKRAGKLEWRRKRLKCYQCVVNRKERVNVK